MKTIRKVTAAVLCTLISSTITPAVHVQADNNVPVYRLYNQTTGEHFLTADSAERENLVINGWNDEGIGFYESTTGENVYRLYNPFVRQHLYTLNKAESDHLQTVGWNYEGIAFHSNTEHSVAVYRAYNPNGRTHNFTTSETEQNFLASAGWNNENTAWYASAAGNPNAILPGFYHYSLPYYSQLDSRWRNTRYGGYTFGGTGCVPTSLAMAFQGIKGGTVLPTDVGTWAHSNSNFDRRNQGSSDAVVPACASHWGVRCDNIQSLDQLTDALKHGKPCVIVVDGGNAFMSGNVAHCVVLHSYSNGSAYVSDPYFSHNCKYWNISFMWSIRTKQSYLLDNSPYYCYALY